MTGEQSQTARVMSNVAGLEAHLAAKLAEATDGIARMEFFDSEQRAEVYTILHAMKADTEVHRKLVGRWISDVTGEVTDV